LDKNYSRRIYHPLVTRFAETGDLLDAVLRPGNVGTAMARRDFMPYFYTDNAVLTPIPPR